MQRPIVSDASCFIILDKIGEFHLLQQLFGSVITTPQVEKEFGRPLPNWVEVKRPSNVNSEIILRASIDEGEASAIALSLELDDPLIILDDLKARNFAIQLGMKVTGTLGILVECKFAGHIPSLKAVITKIKGTNFRISEELERLVLMRANEL